MRHVDGCSLIDRRRGTDARVGCVWVGRWRRLDVLSRYELTANDDQPALGRAGAEFDIDAGPTQARGDLRDGDDQGTGIGGPAPGAPAVLVDEGRFECL